MLGKFFKLTENKTNIRTEIIAGGIFFYTVLKVAAGKAKQVHWMMYILFALVVICLLYTSDAADE